MAHCRDDDLWSERQGGHHDPPGYGAVIGPKWCAARDVVKELAFDTVYYSFAPTWSVACRESPAVFAITHEIHRIANRVLLLDECRLPAVFKIIAAAFTHKCVAQVTKIDPQV